MLMALMALTAGGRTERIKSLGYRYIDAESLLAIRMDNP